MTRRSRLSGRRLRPWLPSGAVVVLAAASLLASPPGAMEAQPPAAEQSPPAPRAAPAPQAAPAPGATPALRATPAPEAAPTPEPRPGRRVAGTIMGSVYDAKKKPLAGWMVQLSSRGQDALLRVTGTNEKGQYVFRDLPAGKYDIEVGSGNEGSRRKGPIDVRPPFRNIVDFQIGPQAGETPNPLAGLLARRKSEAAPGPGAGGKAPEGAAPGDAAPEEVPVRGRFVDAQQRPVREVEVTIVSLNGRGVFQAFSGEDGSFAIPAVPPGRYRMLVASPGYVTIDLRSIEIPRASGLNLSLSLVDHPLDIGRDREERLPPEEPLPAPPPEASTSSPS